MNFEKGAFVSDLDFTDASGRMTVNRLHVERANGPPTVAVAPDDIVLVTTGSQAADLRAGTMDEAPSPEPPYPGRSWALWKTLAAKHKGFGDPSVFFGDDKILDSRWVTFTVTTKRKEFLDEIINLTGSGTGSGGLLTLRDFALGDLAVDLRAAGNPRSAARHLCLVGLWAPSGEQRHP